MSLLFIVMLTLNCLVYLENLLEAEQKLKLINLKKSLLSEWVRIFVEAVKYLDIKFMSQELVTSL